MTCPSSHIWAAFNDQKFKLDENNKKEVKYTTEANVTHAPPTYLES